MLGAIESAVHEEVSNQMEELFCNFPKIYFHKEDIFPKLKKIHEKERVHDSICKLYDRVGPKGRDEILSDLKEKGVIKEYLAVEQIKYRRNGRIKSIGELLDPTSMRNNIDWDEIEGKIQVHQYAAKDEAILVEMKCKNQRQSNNDK